MNGRLQHLRTGQGLLGLLLFCAIALRLAVPAGYMPSFSEGRVTLIVCSASGSREMAVDFGDADKDQKQTGGSDCIFASGLGGGLLPPAPWIFAAASLPAANHLLQRAIADLTPHRLAAPPPPALGPPPRS